ncbi:unnamed protein product [Caenorhabditis angaria]|uniref:Uncharacterized protein n=1 Tax=Caenorhabditis angaria TaxID=860376 RepID=A0A9P1IRZ9_9PELO|nr:unnamed protein product [Caenorhabditis angaria]
MLNSYDCSLVLYCSIPIVFGICWGLNVYFLMGPSIETDQAIRDILLVSLDMNLDEIAYIGPRCYEKTLNNQ